MTLPEAPPRTSSVVTGGAGGIGLAIAERLAAEGPVVVLDLAPRLAALRDLPRRELYDLPDPRLDVLEKALVRGRAVRVTIEE